MALEMRKEDQLLHTSEAEELDEEERADNPELTYAVFIKLNGKLLWKGQYPKGILQDFDIYDFEQFVWDNAGKEAAWKPTSEVQKILASCKAKDSRSTWEYQQISEFSTEEWDKVDAVIFNQVADWKYELKVRLEVFFETPKPDIRRHMVPKNPEISSKRSQEVLISSDPPQQSDDDDDIAVTPRPTAPPSKKQRVHRSGQLIEASRKRGEENARAGRFEKALVDRHDESCTNNKDKKGFCFVDYGCKHYAIEPADHARWAKAIEKGNDDISIERPPLDLYIRWVGYGPVTQDTQRSEAYKERQEAKAERENSRSFAAEGKDIFSQYNQMIESRIKWDMMKSMK
ncbi:MAG: hypothetical protein Q9201_007228, partial [Fulgogasparrea decipioides]